MSIAEFAQTFGSGITILVAIIGGAWKLRRWLKDDMQKITDAALLPLDTKLTAFGDLAAKHEIALYGDGGANKGALYEIAYLRGRSDERAELGTRAAQAIGQIVQEKQA